MKAPQLPFTDNTILSIAKRLPLRELKKSTDIYFDLTDAIVSQQLSGKVAQTIFNRFLALFPNSYPTPNILLNTPDEELRSAGLSKGKAAYLKNLAQFALTNSMDLDYIESMSDDEIITYLTQVKGIGKWTVEMILIFSLNRPNIFPVDDLAIKQTMMELYKLSGSGNVLIRKLEEIASKWSPNRTIATLYLWEYANDKKKRIKK
ncbi:MAG TPA: hypothetical protein PLC17_05955 [Tenuifilaceae bacterium]|nr:hypothetical protein [Tenuifilaceae bacterium]HQB78001.1 hypothetical protein [Tenuifilaceae bacterium]